VKANILNLATKETIEHFRAKIPLGAQWFPITLYVTKELFDTLKAYLERSSYTRLKDGAPIPREGYTKADWLDIRSSTPDYAYWICVSERVYNDTKFRGLLVEYLI
jgi:hypothetical protein